MKPMKDRKMDMSKGRPKSEPFFPEEAERREMPKCMGIDNFKYPDTDQAVYKDQEDTVKMARKANIKPGFRH